MLNTIGAFAKNAVLKRVVAPTLRLARRARAKTADPSIGDLLRQPRSRKFALSDSEKAAKAEFNQLQRTLMETSDSSERRELLAARPATPLGHTSTRF